MTLRAPLREERQVLLLWGAVACGIVLFWPALPGLARFLPRCPFKELTGLPCLGCGSTRAALALLRGDVGAALGANPLAALGGILFVAGGFLAPLWAVLRLPVPDSLPVATAGRRAAGIALLLAAWAWQVARGI